MKAISRLFSKARLTTRLMLTLIIVVLLQAVVRNGMIAGFDAGYFFLAWFPKTKTPIDGRYVSNQLTHYQTN